MENSFQTSFIPKKPINSPETKIRQPKSFFFVISVILLILTILSSVGFLLYKNYLTDQRDALSSGLLKSRDSFDQSTINELERFDNRAGAAKALLSNHDVFSPVFSLLNKLTVPTIQYKKFDLSLNNDNKFEVQLSGIAQDYKSIALQSDALNNAQNPYFKNVIFSDLNKDKDNNVVFNLDFILDPSLISYEKNFSLKQALDNSSGSSTTSSGLINNTNSNN